VRDHWDLVLEILVTNSHRDKDPEVKYDMLVILEAFVY